MLNQLGKRNIEHRRLHGEHAGGDLLRCADGDGQLRFEKPTLISAAPENGLFLQEAMDRLLRGEKEGRKELAAWFPVLVQGGRTADLRRTMKQLGRGAKEKDAPAVQLLLVAMETAMQEENA